MNHGTEKSNIGRQIEIKYKIWSGLGEAVIKSSSSLQDVFFELYFCENGRFELFDLYKHLQFTSFTIPVLKINICYS